MLNDVSSSELLSFAKESLSLSEFEHFQLSMEADGIKLDMHKAFLRKVAGQITTLFRSKPTRERLFEISIIKSNGDITKVKNIETSLNVLKVLEKSKESDIKADAKMLLDFYQELKKRKTQWMKCKALTKNGNDRFVATMADVTYYGLYVFGVKEFVSGTSYLLVRLTHPKLHKREGTFSLLGNVREQLSMYRKGTMDQCINAVLKQEKSATEAIETAIIVTIGLIVAFITVCMSIRIFTYYFYYTRMQLADYFEQQARFLDLHASELKKNKSMTEVEKNGILRAQKAWAERFEELSELIADDDIASVKKVTGNSRLGNQELKAEVKRMASSNVTPMNNDASSNEIDVPNTGMNFF